MTGTLDVTREDAGSSSVAHPTPAQHERNVRDLRCVICDHPQVTIHHCHGGSMLDIEWLANPGMGQRANPYLVIPLHAKYHVGNQGIDAGMGVRAWEARHGSQLSFLHEVERQLGYELWQMARAWEETHRRKSKSR
ncbi:MAG: hypothetical protein V2J89_17115 [Halieaceae bacterium]|jgi:hypothetical protein|nr:hypothetical protein [Halieaceae bacterium]